MGDVVSLTVAREAKAARARVDAERTLHPSLRWIVGSSWWSAHARRGGTTVCGKEGSLVLAPPGVPLCRDCYPQGGARQGTP